MFLSSETFLQFYLSLNHMVITSLQHHFTAGVKLVLYHSAKGNEIDVFCKILQPWAAFKEHKQKYQILSS